MFGAALADPPLFNDLFGQVRHADLTRSSGVERGFHGGPDVVGVDVAVVEAVATDDDDGVTDARPHLSKGVHLVVLGVEEVHHLVAQVRDRGLAGLGLLVHVDRDRIGRRRDRQGIMGDHAAERVEEQQQTRTTRVDDTGLLQYRELLGREGQRVLGAVSR